MGHRRQEERLSDRPTGDAVDQQLRVGGGGCDLDLAGLGLELEAHLPGSAGIDGDALFDRSVAPQGGADLVTHFRTQLDLERGVAPKLAVDRDLWLPRARWSG